jgi:hypothetical protein
MSRNSDLQLAILIPLERGDRRHPHNGTPVHLPKNLRTELRQSVLRRRTNVRAAAGSHDAGVLVLCLKSKHIINRDHANGIAHTGRYPADSARVDARQSGTQGFEHVGLAISVMRCRRNALARIQQWAPSACPLACRVMRRMWTGCWARLPRFRSFKHKVDCTLFKHRDKLGCPEPLTNR